MRTLLERGGVAFCGLLTSLLTAVLVTLFDLATGFNAFTLSVWVIVPVGAGLCGFAAASGYYLAARYLHLRPSKSLLIQMVAIAAFTQWLIYWFEYQTTTIDGIHVADRISFFTYLSVILTSAHMRLGRAMVDSGEVGSFGYWLAAFQFVGFLIGGLFVYFHLKALPTCGACSKYLRPVAKKEDSFANLDSFAPYYDSVYSNAVDSAEFADHVGADYSAGDATPGTINLTTTVYECPQCFGQSIHESVQVYSGKQWSDVGQLTRFVAMPAGVDVRPLFGSKYSAAGWF
jgi:hypothetical protein